MTNRIEQKPKKDYSLSGSINIIQFRLNVSALYLYEPSNHDHNSAKQVCTFKNHVTTKH